MLANFALLVRLAYPFFQRAHGHIPIAGYVLNAACTSLPDFAQGLFLSFNGVEILCHKLRSNADHPGSSGGDN